MKYKLLSPQSFLMLERISKALGWLMVVTSILVVLIKINDFRRSYVSTYDGMVTEDLQLKNRPVFSLLEGFHAFFDGTSKAFFAFLMSSVFRMARKRKPVRSKQADTFLNLCCGSYAALGIIDIFFWFRSIFTSFSSEFFGPYSSWTKHAVWVFSYAVSALQQVSPLLYAVSIFVIYRHFASMVTFESEVA